MHFICSLACGGRRLDYSFHLKAMVFRENMLDHLRHLKDLLRSAILARLLRL